MALELALAMALAKRPDPSSFRIVQHRPSMIHPEWSMSHLGFHQHRLILLIAPPWVASPPGSHRKACGGQRYPDQGG